LKIKGGKRGIIRYLKERKEAVLRKILPPDNRTIKEFTAEEGISQVAVTRIHQNKRVVSCYLQCIGTAGLNRKAAQTADDLPIGRGSHGIMHYAF